MDSSRKIRSIGLRRVPSFSQSGSKVQFDVAKQTITTMLKKLKATLRPDQFLPSPLSIATSSVYIIRRGLYKSILSVAPMVKGDILDFGCGSKPYESLFVNASRYVGVDIEVSGHSHEQSKVDVYYDGRTLPFPDNHFDAVISFEVFEHIFNIDEVMVEIRRVLKPGGQILLTIPFAWAEHEVPYDFARYTSYGIRSVLEKNKYEVVKIEKTTTYVLATCQMFIAYLAQHVLPRNRVLSRMAHLLFIFPLNVLSLFLNTCLPQRYEYFCNSIILARKIDRIT